MIDIDAYFYKFENNRRKPVALIDWKHNGLAYDNPTIDLDQESIKALYDLSQDLRIPLFVVITYTKPNEQPHDMFYVIPRNNPAQKALKAYLGTHKKQWLTPYRFAQLMFQIRGLPFPTTGKATQLSNTEVIYTLPSITKATYGY